MKKPSRKQRNANKRHNESNRRYFVRYANAERHRQRKQRLKRHKWVREHIEDIKRAAARKDIFNTLCRKVTFTKAPLIVEVEGEFGLEEKDRLKEYLLKCSSFVDFNSRELLIDLTNCTRIWPSAVTLLCSLWQWIELASRKGLKPAIAQAPSKEPKVNSYMHHCGLYDYVKIRKKEDTSYYDAADVVKIRKEMNKRNIEIREDEIMDLIERHTSFDSDQREWFNSVILTEVLNNVTEHGISHKDKGWWLLAQYHKRHQMISLCVADNGIGIRNTLVTGPQRLELLKNLDNSAQNDGLFIKKAMEENVSGAITASTKTREGFRMRYSSGSRRGNGLKRIQDCCKKLGIELTILSQNGCISLDCSGNEVYCDSLPNRVVAGTMYQLSIPTY